MREFVCEDCGHKIVVNPRLPLDYMPNICCECEDRKVAKATRLIARAYRFLHGRVGEARHE